MSRLQIYLLGVHISCDLSWDSHIQYMAASRCRQGSITVVLPKAGLPSAILKQIYLTFTRPMLENASPVWGGLIKGLLEELESVQKPCCSRNIGIPSFSPPPKT